MISHGILEKSSVSQDCEIVANENGCDHVEKSVINDISWDSEKK